MPSGGEEDFTGDDLSTDLKGYAQTTLREKMTGAGHDGLLEGWIETPRSTAAPPALVVQTRKGTQIGLDLSRSGEPEDSAGVAEPALSAAIRFRKCRPRDASQSSKDLPQGSRRVKASSDSSREPRRPSPRQGRQATATEAAPGKLDDGRATRAGERGGDRCPTSVLVRGAKRLDHYAGAISERSYDPRRRAD